MKSIALAAALVATLALPACATGEPVASESPAAEIAPATTPTPSGDVAGTVTLPDDFPAKDVPLLDGDILVANNLSGGWSVWVASNDVANDFAAASELLVAVGYENPVTTSDGEESFASFSGEKYQVQITAGVDPTYGPAITYTISPTP